MDSKEMMGFESPGDKKVPVSVRDWNAMKLAVWRAKEALEIVAREAAKIIDQCAHRPGCLGKEKLEAQCLSDRYALTEGTSVLVEEGCPDRENRMSALVILNAAQRFAPVDARKIAREPYFAPSREYFSEVLSDLAAAQIEIEDLRRRLDVHKSEHTVPELENSHS